MKPDEMKIGGHASYGIKYEYVTIHRYSFPVRVCGCLVVPPVAYFPSMSSACWCRSSDSCVYNITPYISISYCVQSVEDSTNSIGEVCTMSPPSRNVWKRKENMVIIGNIPDHTIHNRPFPRLVGFHEWSTQWTVLSPARHGLRYV
jgi:hypothetical protein